MGTKGAVCFSLALLTLGLNGCFRSEPSSLVQQGSVGLLPGELEDPINMEYSFSITEGGTFFDAHVDRIDASNFLRDPSLLNYTKNEVALPRITYRAGFLYARESAFKTSDRWRQD